MLKITLIVNQPVPSNCFVISNNYDNTCVIVDPGTEDCKELIQLFTKEKLEPVYIILTHEHVDHILGIKTILSKHKDAKIVCSNKCNININSAKYNLTGYSEKYEERTSFPEAHILIEKIHFELKWSMSTIKFYPAEGHSLGSVIFKIENHLFVGDTLLKGHRTTTTLPGGSKADLIDTFSFILRNFDAADTIVYPGHNDSFPLSVLKDNISEQIDYLIMKCKKKPSIRQLINQ